TSGSPAGGCLVRDLSTPPDELDRGEVDEQEQREHQQRERARSAPEEQHQERDYYARDSEPDLVRGDPGADRPRRPARLAGLASGPADEVLRALSDSHREPRRPGEERCERNDDAERGDEPDAVAEIPDGYA